MASNLTRAGAKSAGYDIVAKTQKGSAGKGMAWVQLSDGTAAQGKAKVPQDVAAERYGWRPGSISSSSGEGGSRLTVGRVVEYIDKSNEERLTEILKGIGFKQRETIGEILPGIADKIKADEVAKIEEEIKRLQARKKALK